MDVADSLYNFNIVLLGATNVGKSSILKRYTHGSFFLNIPDIIPVQYRRHHLEVEPGVTVTLHLYDTPGDEKYLHMSNSYCRTADGILYVFDLGDYTSLKQADYLRRQLRITWHKNTVLVGNKCDTFKREVNFFLAERLASQWKVPYYEVSAKTGHNVAEIFELLTRRIYQNSLTNYKTPDTWDGDPPSKMPITAQNDENKLCCVS